MRGTLKNTTSASGGGDRRGTPVAESALKKVTEITTQKRRVMVCNLAFAAVPAQTHGEHSMRLCSSIVRVSCGLLLLGCLLLSPAPARAQGLLWKLPKDEGTYARYAGTYQHVQERPESVEGPLELKWLAELTIKCLGAETADFQGQPTPCRWIEFESVTGYESAQGIQPGPYGRRIYKVLIPESQVFGKQVDSDNIRLRFIPIVKGYRQLGEQPPQAVREKVLSVYPLLTLFAYYENLKSTGDESLELGQVGSVDAQHFEGEETLTTSVGRSVNHGELWLSEALPFGWAKYKVKVVREEKDSTAPASEFKKTSEIDVTLEAAENGTDAQSKLDETQVTE